VFFHITSNLARYSSRKLTPRYQYNFLLEHKIFSFGIKHHGQLSLPIVVLIMSSKKEPFECWNVKAVSANSDSGVNATAESWTSGANPKLSDTEFIWYWIYLILNLSDIEFIWYWIYLIPDLYGTVEAANGSPVLLTADCEKCRTVLPWRPDQTKLWLSQRITVH
jgi:hypothetical protein